MPGDERGRAGRNHWFFLAGLRAEPERQVDLSTISHQLRNVLRLKQGNVITLLDGSGSAFPTRIEALTARVATGLVLAKEPVRSEPVIDLTLYQCVLKRERFEWVLQKGTELGVSRFVPVISSRTVVRPAERLLPKYERWSAIVREAAEQSRRGRLPVLDDPLHWDLALDQGEGVRILVWEDAGANSSVSDRGVCEADKVALLVGPEGGINKEEAVSAISQGWRPLSLGPRVLRAETAALAAVTVVMTMAGELG